MYLQFLGWWLKVVHLQCQQTGHWFEDELGKVEPHKVDIPWEPGSKRKFVKWLNVKLHIQSFDKKYIVQKTYFSGAVTVSLQGAFTADEQEEGLDGHDCVGGHVHAVDDVHVLDTTGSDQSFELE